MLPHVLLLRLLLPFGLLLLFHVRVLAAERLLYVRTSIIRQRHLQVGPGRLSNAKLSWSVLLYCAFCGSICMLCQGFLLFSNLSLYSPHIYIYLNVSLGSTVAITASICLHPRPLRGIPGTLGRRQTAAAKSPCPTAAYNVFRVLIHIRPNETYDKRSRARAEFYHHHHHYCKQQPPPPSQNYTSSSSTSSRTSQDSYSHLRVPPGLVLGVQHLFVHGRIAAVVLVRLYGHFIVLAQGEKCLGCLKNLLHYLLWNTVVLQIEKSILLACLPIPHSSGRPDGRNNEIQSVLQNRCFGCHVQSTLVYHAAFHRFASISFHADDKSPARVELL